MNNQLQLNNINVESHKLLLTPEEVRNIIPLTNRAVQTILQCRGEIKNILNGKNQKIFLVIGPCSIHDVKAAHEYAERLKGLSDKVSDKIVIIMRVYFEKPRTTLGWKGLINDPHMDDSFDIESGIKIARRLLVHLNDMGIPTATEALDPIIPQYISDLISWTAIGARTTESQTHREMASGLSTPVGFKNGTDGNIQVAINAMQSALSGHSFLGIDSQGRISIYKTKGNPYSHVVLRGGNDKPNYDEESITHCIAELKKANLCSKIMVDCSHGNSNKDYKKQPEVFRNVISQISQGNRDLIAMMIESNLYEGNQKLTKDLDQLKYGVSITDACIDWETTEELILEAYQTLK
ncbi:MAG: 3-deoxy-7-phosphoheptulonate synthase [Deltaproteobacteria bacterium]|nr:3-deoxy-7-phosphoheptulonate synthase [Deltaproteobacteria bacterium]